MAPSDRIFLIVERVKVSYLLRYPFFTTTRSSRLPRWSLRAGRMGGGYERLQSIPLPLDEDPYQRPRPSHPPAVEMESDNPTYQSYEVEKMVDKRVRKYNKTNVTQYLVKWLKYGFEHDQWEKNRFSTIV